MVIGPAGILRRRQGHAREGFPREVRLRAGAAGERGGAARLPPPRLSLPDAVAADAKFVDLGADSLDTVEIMMALEEQFEITLDEEGAEKIATVQEAADMIEEQMA